MNNLSKHALYYLLVALYAVVYYPLALIAVPHNLIGNLLDFGWAEGTKLTLRTLFVSVFLYDLDSLRMRVYGGATDDGTKVLDPTPLDLPEDDEPQPADYDHTEHLTHVAAAYAHTGEHKLISDEE